MTDFMPTDEEREYMTRRVTDAEHAETLGMPEHIARGWIIRKRAQTLVDRRQEVRTERIAKAFEDLAKAMQG